MNSQKFQKPILITISLLLIVTHLKCYFNIFSFLKNKYILWVFVLTIVLIVRQLIVFKKNIFFYKGDLLFFMLMTIGVVNFWLLSDVSLYHYKSVYYVGYCSLFLFFRNTLSEIKQPIQLIKYVLGIVVILALVNGVVGVLQLTDVLSSKNKNFELNGLFYSPNQLGLLLSLGVFSTMSYLKLKQNKHIIYSVLGGAICLFLGFLLYLTKSRGALIALFLSIVYLFISIPKLKVMFRETKLKWMFPFLILGVVLLMFVAKQLYYSNTGSINGRCFILKTTLKQIVENPIGYGINSFSKEYNIAKASYFETPREWDEIKNADFVFRPFNDLLEFTFEMGVIWFGVFILFIVSVFKIKNTSVDLKIAKGIIILLGFFSLTNTLIIFPTFMFLLLFSICYLLKEHQTKAVFKIPNYFALRIGSIVPLLLISFLLIQRIQAEARLLAIKKGTKEEVISFLKDQDLKKIDHNESAYRLVSSILSKNKLDSLSRVYLDTAFQKSAMPKIGRPLAFKHIRYGNVAKALELFNYNKNVEPYRYEARMDLFNLYSRNDDVKKALNIAREIKEFPVKVPSKKVDLYKKKVSKYLKTFENIKTDSLLKGILSRGKVFKSKVLNKSLLCYTYQPSLNLITKKIPVLYVNDGIPYLRKGELAKKVDSLVQNKSIEPMMIVFIEPRDVNIKQKRWKIREELYFCNDTYNDFLIDEMIPYIEKRYPVSKLNRGLVGLSFGGLSAAYTAIKNPKAFKNIILQSPAFHTRKEIYKFYANVPKQDFNVYVSYGTGRDTEKQDLPFIKILENKKYNLTVNKVENGNHNWRNWKPLLNDILIKYYGVDKEEVD